MTEAEILRRQCSRGGPGGCVHPIAVANTSKFEKLSMGNIETFAPDNIIPARKGGVQVEFRRAMASETDLDPADWPFHSTSQLGQGSVHLMRLYAP